MYHNQIIITFYMFKNLCIIFSLSSISMAADMLFIYTSCISCTQNAEKSKYNTIKLIRYK